MKFIASALALTVTAVEAGSHAPPSSTDNSLALVCDRAFYSTAIPAAVECADRYPGCAMGALNYAACVVAALDGALGGTTGQLSGDADPCKLLARRVADACCTLAFSGVNDRPSDCIAGFRLPPIEEVPIAESNERDDGTAGIEVCRDKDTKSKDNPSSDRSIMTTNLRCFQDKKELQDAIDAYLSQGCADYSGCEVSLTYGWPMNSWCVSQVTDMSGLFREGKASFNENISGWDTSSVTNTMLMFGYSESFNGNLANWQTSKVKNMKKMFTGAESFNGDLSNWDTSSVTNMEWMFASSQSFNGDLSSWDTSSVETMMSMFFEAESFNGDLSSWDTSSVKDMFAMFGNSKSFNGDLSSWDTSSVEDMCLMFYGASSFNQNLCGWHSNFLYESELEMFTDSGCTYAETPLSSQKGPFCASACE